MSVYRRQGQATFSFDFQFKGRRFSGDTGRTSRREAERVEREKRDALRAEFAKTRVFADAPMTIDEACGRYWTEVGEQAKSWRQVKWSCLYIIKNLGADLPIRDIDDVAVSMLAARRRGETVDNVMVNRKVANGGCVSARKRVSAATVNRSVIEPLRRILRRASLNWGEQVRPVNWAAHKLKEPLERVRYATDDEEKAIFEKLPLHYHGVVRFAILSGLRASEICGLRWTDIDWGAKSITIRGKGGKIAPIPMSDEMESILLRSKQKAATATPVFTNLGGEQLTYRALFEAFRTACRKANVANLRLHDLRHTAATRLLRETGNIKLTQRLLRHSDIGTTGKYAHVVADDLRDAMNAVSAKKVPQKVPQNASK